VRRFFNASEIFGNSQAPSALRSRKKELLSLHQRGAIEHVEDKVGEELIRQGAAMEIPAMQHGPIVSN